MQIDREAESKADRPYWAVGWLALIISASGIMAFLTGMRTEIIALILILALLPFVISAYRVEIEQFFKRTS
jgi:hypothetical protein